MSHFSISGHELSKTLLESEQENWALSTGQKHKTEGELAAWAKENGKEIVAPGWKPKPVDLMTDPGFDHEVDKALDKVYQDNHRIEVSS